MNQDNLDDVIAGLPTLTIEEELELERLLEDEALFFAAWEHEKTRFRRELKVKRPRLPQRVDRMRRRS